MKQYLFITPLGTIFSQQAPNKYIASQKLQETLCGQSNTPCSAYYYLTRTCGYCVIADPFKKLYTPKKMTPPQKVMLEQYQTRRFY